MEYTKRYHGKVERKELCDIANSNGFRMLHDNFDPDWKRGEEPRGELLFTDEVPAQAKPEPTKLELLEARVLALENK